MQIVSWNVNGIRAVDRKNALNWAFDAGLDLFCIQETKAHREQLKSELIEPPGWRSAFSQAEKKGYSGTAIFTLKESEWELTSDLDLDLKSALLGEGRITKARIDGLVVYNVYFPNGGRGHDRLEYKYRFYDEFRQLVAKDRARGDSVVVCGDFNIAHKEIDVADPEKWSTVSGFLPEERSIFSSFLNDGYLDSFRLEHGDLENQYTWWDMRTFARGRNHGWRIDYVLLSEDLEESMVDAWISPEIMGSDHCPVGVELEC